MALPFVDRSSSSLPIQIVGQSSWRKWLKEQSAARRGWLESTGVTGKAGDLAVLPGRDGKAAGAVLVLSAKPTLWDFGALATRLPAGTWRLASDTAPVSPTDAAVAIGLGTWRFERYRTNKGKAGAKIVWPQGADKARATAMIEAISMARDLITTPSSDMGPAELAARGAGSRQGAQGQDQGDRGRRSSEAELSHGARRRPRQLARAAPDRPDLGQGERSQGDAGRQGRVLRHRRPRSQARRPAC